MHRYLSAVMVALTLMIGMNREPSAAETSAFDRALKVLLNEERLSQQQRILVARGLAERCGELQEKIPTLSPREEEWVERERSAGRAEQLYASVEFAKQEVKYTFQVCFESAEALVESVANNAPNELLLWSFLMQATASWTLFDHMNTVKRSDAAGITAEDISFVTTLGLVTSRIIATILRPGLQDQISPH